MRPSTRLLHAIRSFRVLGIESSADDSCAAVVDSSRRILSNVVIKQHDIHVKFGGIHPIKSQDAHAANLPIAIRRALEEADMTPQDIDLIAYTRGPGMYGTLSVGAHSARGLAAVLNIPIVGVHHMQAHALTPFLTAPTPPAFPFLTLLVSGGHTLLVLATDETNFRILVKSLDDSIGDAFDKTARLLQIPWIPGMGPGPSLEQYALPDPSSGLYASIPPFSLPTRKQLAFSFAGLKSNVERATKKLHSNLQLPMKESLKRAMARRFQEAAVGSVVEKVGMALDVVEGMEELRGKRLGALVVSGGVASNAYLRERLKDLLKQRSPGDSLPLVFPPVELCTDNAAMIAWAGYLRYRRQNEQSDPFDQLLRPKWSLEDIDD